VCGEGMEQGAKGRGDGERREATEGGHL